MVFPLLRPKVNYYKNGQFKFTKMISRIIGEDFYDKLRLEKRIVSNRWYYFKQKYLYDIFMDFPDIACSLGLYPKIDFSHGFPNPYPYEVFRDFQENSINGEGYFAWLVLVICALYVFHYWKTYMVPYYAFRRPIKNEEYTIQRFKDYLSTCILEENFGNQFLEIPFTPHAFHSKREQALIGYSTPDDVRTVHFSTFNRKHKYKEHYAENVGYGSSMKHFN